MYAISDSMKINTKIRYGLRTMIEIACCHNPEGILQKDIAIQQNISVKYLDYIISALTLKGLIMHAKGRGTGYILARPASEITMLDIYTAFEQVLIVQCLSNDLYCERSSHCCKANLYWKEFQKQFIGMLSSKNLEQIIHETKEDCAVCN